MKMKKAKNRIKRITNKQFKCIFSDQKLKQIKNNKNKGIVGQLLEKKIGLKLSNKNRDFKNGELKTYTADKNSYQKEAIYIIQISNIIDDLIKNKKFEKTKLYKKIKNILFVPFCKNGVPEDWIFLKYIHIKSSKQKYESLYDQIKKDYNRICKKIKNDIKANEKIHHIREKYLEINIKDSKNKNGDYHQIYSQKYNKIVSDTNYAFYFTKNFIEDIINNYK